ncbi:hypothetical protein STPL106120_08545 [Streptococcus pluranimalium]
MLLEINHLKKVFRTRFSKNETLKKSFSHTVFQK